MHIKTYLYKPHYLTSINEHMGHVNEKHSK